MTYNNWRARLAIAEKYSTVAERRAAVAALKINFSQPGEADEGYYRKPVTEKHPTNGQNKVVGWIPVAYYRWEGKLAGTIGAGEQSRSMTDAEVGDEELWSYVVSNPIPYEWYSAVADHGDVWPDQPIHQNEADNRVQGDVVPPAESPPRAAVEQDGGHHSHDHNNPPKLPPHVEHATAIDNAIGAGKGLKATTAAEAALAAGAANLIRDRRLAAEKAGKIRIDPLKLAYETERNSWLPPVQRAKAAEDVLRKEVSNFEIAERKRIAQEQLDAMEKQRQQEEANARAADRAIGAGEPEPPPVVEEVAIPQAPQPVKPTYGGYKPATRPLKKFAVIGDDVEVYKFLRANVELKELIQKLATNAIQSGFEVPGTTTREGIE